MTEIRATTVEGEPIGLRNTAVSKLDDTLRGRVLVPHADEYDDARRIWNGMVDRRPAVIARCVGTADVVQAVRFARDYNLLTSIRGGGHNVAGNAVCDGGLMIDLSSMREVHADPGTLKARASGGATWGDFDATTQLFGLATTGGLISDTGVAGLTLGGGLGWLTPSHGLACDNLNSVDVVTADGAVVHASDNENEDLFFGLKGGGGNFGVATSFEFNIHPVGPVLFGGMALYAIDDAEAVLRHFVDFQATKPDALGTLAAFTVTPDGQSVLALVALYNGALDDGEAALADVRRFQKPLVDTFGPIEYCKMQTLFDAGAPPGLRYYWKSSFVDRLPDDALGAIIEQVRCRPSCKSKIFLEFLGGAFARVPREATVFDHRQSPYDVLIIGCCDDPAEDEANRAWTRRTWDAIAPYASEGVYVNYLGTAADEGSDRVAQAYGPGKLKRLTALKRKYDPDNLFRMNQNIRP